MGPDPSPGHRTHTLRIRGADAWKMAEGLGVNFFLTSGT